MEQDELHAKRAVNPVREGLERTGLYHSIRLPDGRVMEGAMPLEYQEDRWRWFGLPEDLTGLRALDVGPWDGYFTFELERRGADVTAIDYTDLDTFRKLHGLFQSKAKYINLDLYDVSQELLGEFDIVLLLGVLYHLKHPLLALEKVCAITRDICIIDTYVCDPEAYRNGESVSIPYAEFYERGELGGQLDNWCGPTVTQVEAWARAAGFAYTEVVKVTSTTACVRAHRRWRNLPPATEPALVLHGVNSPANGGRSFRSSQESYLNLWCGWTSKEVPAFDVIYPEVDGLGVAPIFAELTPFGMMVTTRVPPGLKPGRHEVRMRIGASEWSGRQPFYMDLEPIEGPITLAAVQDAIDAKAGEVDWAKGGWLTLWVDGLSEVADFGNVVVEVDGVPHRPQAIAPGQVNIQLRPLLGPGQHEAVISHRGVWSNSLKFAVVGDAPLIKGFESL